MLWFEKIQCVHIDDPNDKPFVEMAFRNACQQMGVEEGEIKILFDRVGFFGLKGETVSFKISSAYGAAEIAVKVIKRFYDRLYETRGKRHNLHVWMPNEPKPVKMECTIAEPDRHGLESKLGS